MLVKTRLGVSDIHGIGLFADEPIGKGTLIWRSNPTLDIRLTRDQIDDLAPPAREQMRKYTYREKCSGLYVLCGDDARFFNHTENPNCLDICSSTDGDVTIAARDIAEGEELTCDYAAFDADLQEGKYEI